jgi:NADP-dependent aldehyde dehydrogenase
MKLEGLSILGQSRGSRGGRIFFGINPATGTDLPGEFHSSAAAEVAQAAGLAQAAFGEYSGWPAARRWTLLQRIAELLEANAGPICERANLETALPPARLQGELARTCFQLRFYGEAVANGLSAGVCIDPADSDHQPQPRPELRALRIPVGPVVVFGASNFPLAYSVAGGDTASALAAGCPVIVKAHPAHPGTSELVGLLVQQAARELGAPAGVFSMLFDAGHEIGAALVRHPAVKAVGFTGSRRGGRALMDLAAARPEPIPVYAEMGSVNPVFILPGAAGERADQIAGGLHASFTLGVGQFCTNPGLVFIQSGADAERFLARLKELTTTTAAGTMLTRALCADFHAGAKRFQIHPQVETLVAPSAPGAAPSATAGAALFATTAASFLEDRTLMAEVFGPDTLVVRCESWAQMLAAASALEGQLTASIHAQPTETGVAGQLLAILSHKAGRLIWNGFPTGVEVAHAMTHGGPYPATSDGRSTSVGPRAVDRWLRLVSFQNFPEALLPAEVQAANPQRWPRLVAGRIELP